jgi:transposase InsO family protein
MVSNPRAAELGSNLSEVGTLAVMVAGLSIAVGNARVADNGPYYTARETSEFARSPCLWVCTKPTYSPQSNGVAEAFVKTFKRGYVFMNQLLFAAAVTAQFRVWFAHYNAIRTRGSACARRASIEGQRGDWMFYTAVASATA